MVLNNWQMDLNILIGLFFPIKPLNIYFFKIILRQGDKPQIKKTYRVTINCYLFIDYQEYGQYRKLMPHLHVLSISWQGFIEQAQQLQIM